MSHFLHFTACAFAVLFVVVFFYATGHALGFGSGLLDYQSLGFTRWLLVTVCCICGLGLCVQQGFDAYKDK